MDILRTPDERFADLPDFPYAPIYTEIPDGDGGTLRMAHVEDGEGDEAVLCLHGEPTWSFLYRKMLPRFAAAGYRAVAPDLVGFGRSDKPAARSDYTYARHLAWLDAWLAARDLRRITLVAQDWGGLLGLRLLVEHPERFARLVVANTFLPTGETMNDAFNQWRDFSQSVPVFEIGRLIAGSCQQDVSAEVVAAYDAPFPDESFKAAARQFPMLVPTEADAPGAAENRQAWKALGRWDRPTLTAFSDGDPIMRGLDKVFQKLVPGCQGQPHTTIEGAGHFLQEDRGEVLADAVIAFMKAS